MAFRRKYYPATYGIVRKLRALGHSFHVGDGWTVQAKSAVRTPLQDLHDSDAVYMMRILRRDRFGFGQARREHDIDSKAAVSSRARKKQAAGAVLIIQPLSMRFVVALLVLILF
jgi:hypothetical protein